MLKHCLDNDEKNPTIENRFFLHFFFCSRHIHEYSCRTNKWKMKKVAAYAMCRCRCRFVHNNIKKKHKN